jgi:uncharacterized OB-fold protein
LNDKHPASSPPLPDVEQAGFAEYWAALKRGKIVVPTCSRCGTKRWPPRHLCAHCFSALYTWTELQPFGRLFTWTTIHRAALPGFSERVPYVVGVVESLHDPAIRFVGNVVVTDPSSLEIGMSVCAVFEAVTEAIVLCHWRPQTPGGS